MSLKEFVKELNGKSVEGELIKAVFISVVTSLVVLFVMYFSIFKGIEDFIPKYGFWIFFTILSYAVIFPVTKQVRAYKRFPCMTGMMIGMTIGMMAGFLIGYWVGATNGMFWGSVYGMVVGIILGVWNGKCCGIMGIMEGMMAGFMGGLMGAMTAVMMFNDHLKAGGVIVFVVCAAILLGLNYMIFKETKGADREVKEDSFKTMVLSAIFMLATLWMIVLGPRSVLLQ